MKRHRPCIILFCSTAIGILAVLLLAPASEAAQSVGQPIVELSQGATTGVTAATEFTAQKIGGTDNSTKKEYKFQRQREGKNFSYVVANLYPSYSYRVELSFVEHDHSSSGKRVFNVYLQSGQVLNALDVYSRAGGRNRAYQRTFTTSSDAAGRIAVQFRSDQSGGKDLATVSTVRVYSATGSSTVVEISAAASRNRMSMPVRHENSATQNVFESLLGRMGSRFSLNLAPQRLAARFSTLGTGTGDLQDLVLALYDGAAVRALPFTDRFQTWESIYQRQTMTSQVFDCASAGTPFQVNTAFRAPFYPRDPVVSGAPFVYVNVTIKNAGSVPASADFILAFPHKREFAASAVTPFENATEKGFQYSNSYTYFDESISNVTPRKATEALAVSADAAGDVQFRGLTEADYTDFTPYRLWGLGSPAGYPKKYDAPGSPMFTFYPRGYMGAVWSPGALAPGETRTKTFIVAGHTQDRVLHVKNSSYDDSTFRFLYTRYFANVQQVVNYAVNQKADITAKSDFFDSTIASDSYLRMDSSYAGPVRDLVACGFQSFLANTWWNASDSGREWFSVWEGTECRFHSTVDVEYNHAWFYFHFWPELLPKVMDQWLLYTKKSGEGTYLSHDMGWGDAATGQSYPHDMPVEENADYVLLLYKYWKTTGDDAYMKARFSTVRKMVDFLINCDTNGNGLPNLNASNTLDQSTWALQYSEDQTYLGVKCLAAHQAAREMASVVGDWTYRDRCHRQVELINQTLEQDLWLSDHFAVCLDGDAQRADREAYSIYAGNGLLYLLCSGRSPAVTSGNAAKFRTDLESATTRTLKEYGCTHSSHDSYNEWVSQNLWRDQVACYLGVDLSKANPLAMSKRYWSLMLYFARYLNGAFWDVLVYPGGSGPTGASTEAGGGPVIETVGSGSASGNAQSLGYYPRGAAALGLIDAVAGLALDVPGGSLYYEPTTRPLAVPVFARADWLNPDPSKRVPVLSFSASGAPAVSNRGLLPATLQLRRELEMKDVTGGAHALSPNDDGVNDSAAVSYTLPTPAGVETSIWEGTRRVRRWTSTKKGSGRTSFEWDGKSGEGEPVRDGIYTARIDATANDKRYSVMPAGAQLWVNNSVPDLSTDWYLAEGFTGRNATGGEFEEYVLIQNPNPEQAAVEVTFMLPGGATDRRSYSVAPNSRFTITVDDIQPNAEVSTHVHADRRIAVERAMYFNGRRAGHASTGVTHPAKAWYLAEGYTAQSFDEYVLIQNPGDEAARIEATFMTPNMGNVKKNYTVGPHSRFTIHVDDILPSHEISTEILSDAPVVVERAQYLNNMTAGTCSIAAASTSRTWFLAEGYTDQGFEEYVLIQNPGDTSNEVTVTFMEKSGANTVRNYSLPPACRFTIGVDEILPKAEVSVKVRAQKPVLVERAMYWNNRSDGHACIGTPTPDTEWYLAEGYTAQGFETWILVQNPGNSERNVTFTFMETSGRNTVKTYTVAPRSRFTVGVNELLPETEMSTRVSADGAVIVERAMYFNNRSGGTDSLGIRGF